LAGAGLGLAVLTAGLSSRANAQATARELFDFEQDVQGFAAIHVKDGALQPDAAGSVTLSRETVKNGTGSLHWTYKSEAGQMRALAGEVKLPPAAQSLSFWLRTQNQTSFMLHLREADGSTYQLTFHAPAYDWTRVNLNLSELTLAENEQDENGKLDVDQVAYFGLLDFSSLVASFVGNTQPHLVGDRRLWLDDLRFAAEAVPQSRGLVKVGTTSAFVVDNFEADAIRWLPARVVFADQPTFEIFPADTSLRILTEAAGPGAGKLPTEVGGRGLRFAYKRAEKEAFAMVAALDGADLSRAERLRLNLRMSQKSLVLVSVKEKDGSEYRHTIMPDQSEGWQALDLALTDLTLTDDSKDENNMLDPGQIKEISLLDASAFLGPALGQGDTTLDLDAISFALKG